MAQAMLGETKLRLVFEIGIDEKGEPILKSKTLSNIKKEATADQLNQSARALAILSNDSLTVIQRADSSEIIG